MLLWDMSGLFQVSLTIRVLDLRFICLYSFKLMLSLVFLWIVLQSLPLDCCIWFFGLSWLRIADNLKSLSLYLTAVAAIRFLRYLLLAAEMMPIPILVITWWAHKSRELFIFNLVFPKFPIFSWSIFHILFISIIAIVLIIQLRSSAPTGS